MHRAVSSTVESWLSSGRFDIGVSDFLDAAGNFPAHSKTPCILFQQNAESQLWELMAKMESNPIKKLFLAVESAKMKRYERATLGRVRYVVAVSEHDRAQMLEMNPACEITVVPTGVDTGRFKVAPPSLANPPRIVFTGSMDWEPNIDAAAYFCSRVWPRIRQEFPDAVFQIVGRNPAAKVLRLASDSVQVTGTVPAVAEYLEGASVVVVPLRIGGGTRLKIFEAMAMGRAVVSTLIGAEGLDVESGRDILLADDADAFVRAVLLLLRDVPVRRRLENAAVQTAARYNWPNVAAQFAEVLRSLTAKASGAPTAGVR
jgi:glycosyltransferase involved in cell wall biosynthesis